MKTLRRPCPEQIEFVAPDFGFDAVTPPETGKLRLVSEEMLKLGEAFLKAMRSKPHGDLKTKVAVFSFPEIKELSLSARVWVGSIPNCVGAAGEARRETVVGKMLRYYVGRNLRLPSGVTIHVRVPERRRKACYRVVVVDDARPEDFTDEAQMTRLVDAMTRAGERGEAESTKKLPSEIVFQFTRQATRDLCFLEGCFSFLPLEVMSGWVALGKLLERHREQVFILPDGRAARLTENYRESRSRRWCVALPANATAHQISP